MCVFFSFSFNFVRLRQVKNMKSAWLILTETKCYLSSKCLEHAERNQWLKCCKMRRLLTIFFFLFSLTCVLCVIQSDHIHKIMTSMSENNGHRLTDVWMKGSRTKTATNVDIYLIVFSSLFVLMVAIDCAQAMSMSINKVTFELT